MMSDKTLDALEACGRERVFENDGTPTMVAIRCSDLSHGVVGDTTWIVADGKDKNEAGQKAAQAFAVRLRSLATALEERAASLRSQAERILLRLDGKT